MAPSSCKKEPLSCSFHDSSHPCPSRVPDFTPVSSLRIHVSFQALPNSSWCVCSPSIVSPTHRPLMSICITTSTSVSFVASFNNFSVRSTGLAKCAAWNAISSISDSSVSSSESIRSAVCPVSSVSTLSCTFAARTGDATGEAADLGAATTWVLTWKHAS